MMQHNMAGELGVKLGLHGAAVGRHSCGVITVRVAAAVGVVARK